MAFGYSGNNLPRIKNHAAALDVWHRVKPWRGQTESYDGRPLENRRKKNVTIRVLHDGSVACRLYNTDVVTFTPDDTLVVRPYASQGTNTFFNRMLRCDKFSAVFTRFAVSAEQQDGIRRIYCTTGVDRLVFEVATGKLLSEPSPWKSRTINTSAAARVRKASQYKAFMTWLQMMTASKLFTPNQPYRLGFNPSALVAALNSDDRARWFEMVVFSNRMTGEVDVPRTLERVRKALYWEHSDEVYDETTDTYFTSWAEVDIWHQRGRRERYRD